MRNKSSWAGLFYYTLLVTGIFMATVFLSSLFIEEASFSDSLLYMLYLFLILIFMNLAFGTGIWICSFFLNKFFRLNTLAEILLVIGAWILLVLVFHFFGGHDGMNGILYAMREAFVTGIYCLTLLAGLSFKWIRLSN
jgi:hypothetical protein